MSCPRVFVTFRLLSDGSCRRAFRIHLGCDRASGSKLLQRALKACCEKITLWVFAGHWLRAPRTRGWTVRVADDLRAKIESPAHAGMDRCRTVRSTTAAGEPRARGDGPTGVPAGIWSRARAPRTRGWTVLLPLGFVGAAESPAHAGMDRRSVSKTEQARPRAPRTRGWTGRGEHHRHAGEESPAHAGMDRSPRNWPTTRA